MKRDLVLIGTEGGSGKEDKRGKEREHERLPQRGGSEGNRRET